MKPIIIESIICLFAALLVTRTAIPMLSRKSEFLGLIDKPNNRKVHHKPIPLIGGIAIVIGVLFSILISEHAQQTIIDHLIIFAATAAIFIIGVWDDRADLSAKFRLGIQIMAAIGIAISGIRLDSFYGIFGIYELPIVVQYIATVVIITGVSNAFNLIDGIDGLAGGLALFNMATLALLAGITEDYGLMIVFISFTGALFSFLKSNRHPALIFMGDGGSMMLGFFMACTSIRILQSASETIAADALLSPSSFVLIISSILIVPVVDALRVFGRRYVDGKSVFTPDKSHLHHLILKLGINHKKVANSILLIEIFLVLFGIIVSKYLSITIVFMLLFFILLVIAKVLAFNTKMLNWQAKLKQLELQKK